MKIYNHEVDNNLILQYCRIITALEKQYSQHLDRMRTTLHDEIYESVNLNRSGISREDRRFATALSNTVADITFVQ